MTNNVLENVHCRMIAPELASFMKHQQEPVIGTVDCVCPSTVHASP